MIDYDGHCVIADLGGCDIIPGISPTQPLARLSPGIITPEFAAPELYQRDESGQVTYTQAVDLWSLGATLCELITHAIPRHLKRPNENDEDDGYSLQALGLEPHNIHKTLIEYACPAGFTGVLMEVRCLAFLVSSFLMLSSSVA